MSKGVWVMGRIMVALVEGLCGNDRARRPRGQARAYLRAVVAETPVICAMTLNVLPLALRRLAVCCLDSVMRRRMMNGMVRMASAVAMRQMIEVTVS